MNPFVNNEVVLPLADTPIKYNGLKASRLAISLTGSNEWKWFYSSMIQIEYERNLLNICHEKNPFIKEHRKVILTQTYSKDKLWRFICQKINQGIYISMLLDLFYNPFREEYLNTHFNHQSLIHGYNSERRTLFVREFYNHHWITKEIDYFLVYKSFLSNKKSKMYLFKKKNKKSDFNKRKFLLELKCYAKSNYPICFRILLGHLELSKRTYGLNAIREMINNLRNPNYKVSISAELQMLLEHTKTMIMRLQFIGDNYYVDFENEINSYKDLLKNRQQCVFLYLKYELTDKQHILEKIICKLENSINTENKLLSCVEKAISKM